MQELIITDVATSTDLTQAFDVMSLWVQIWHINMHQTRVTSNSTRSALLVLATRAGEARRTSVEVMILEYAIATDL